MAATEPRRDAEVRDAIDEERRRLATSVNDLRDELGDTAAVRARVRRIAVRTVGSALVAGFTAGAVVGSRLRRRRSAR